jgi:D-glycero-D-manno-heptose 1,7-bisphosphate phosphatase
VSSEPGRRPATVFLDRDGTINRKAPEGDYVKSVAEFAFLPGAKEAVRLLTEAGLRIVVVTNQRGIARGLMTEEDVAAIHRHMLDELEAAGGRVEAVYHCPHDRGACDCRKPDIGMFRRAACEHPDLRLDESVVIGDAASDMEAALRLGVPGILVAPEDAPLPAVPVAGRASSLLEAAEWVTSGRWRP